MPYDNHNNWQVSQPPTGNGCCWLVIFLCAGALVGFLLFAGALASIH